MDALKKYREMESLIFLEQIFSIVGLNNSQTISIYRRRPKGTFYRRLPPGGRHPSGAWHCVGRRPVQGGRNAPSKSARTRGGGLGGGTSSSERGSRGQRPMVLFRLDFLQRKSRPPRQRAPGGCHPPPAPPTRWGPGPTRGSAPAGPPARAAHPPPPDEKQPAAGSHRRRDFSLCGGPAPVRHSPGDAGGFP